LLRDLKVTLRNADEFDVVYQRVADGDDSIFRAS
jgi:hypothetical protein